MKKNREKEAAAACETAAAGEKLAAAAKNSFLQKCAAEAVGS